MKTWFVALLFLVVPSAVQAREISVDELSRMTVPKLAKQAYTECSDRVVRMKKSIAQIGSAGHGLDHGKQMFKEAEEAKAAVDIHTENLSRIQAVVRKQLSPEEPAWADAYTTAKDKQGCEAAQAQYQEWAKTREGKKAPASKKDRGKKAAK